jgi:hypothetical protein
MKSFSAILLLFCFGSLQINAQTSTKNDVGISVFNALEIEREGVLVYVPESMLMENIPGFNSNNIRISINGKEIPSQYSNGQSGAGLYLVLDSIKGREKVILAISFPKGARSIYPKKTQAELSRKTGGSFVNREYIGGAFENVNYLRVPPEHKDHSWFIRYEGPGWESDKVAYRFYLDQRNATDVFGKLTDQMVLQQVGLDGFDSYHALQPWGMDVMKVGKSLGLGSIGSFQGQKIERIEKTDSVTCHIQENGPVYSSILTDYFGWKLADKKYDISSLISIHAGTRLTREYLTFKKAPANISTGIVKDKAAPLIINKGSIERWGYLATWGKQSLNGDELGLAVFFDPKNFNAFTDDEFSHVVKLVPSGNELQYYFLAAWVRELDGIRTAEEFRTYIDNVSQELAHPVKVEIIKPAK